MKTSRKSSATTFENTRVDTFESMRVDDLIPYARNARTHSPEQVGQIAASIREFGFISPIIIDAENGIIAGHGRLAAAQKLKLDSVPCIRVEHLTETQKRAYIIADNKLALNAGWDTDLLKVEIATLQEEDFDILLTGFGEDEMKELLGETEEPEPQGDPDSCPEVETEKPAVTVRGMTWLLGNHRLRCGDSTSTEDVALLMAGEKANVMFTSPPYSDLRDYKGGLELNPKHLSRIFDWPVATFFVNLGMQIKERGIVTYWNDYLDAARERNLKLLSWLVWDKGNASAPGHQQAMFGISHEWVFVFGEYKKLNLTKENKGAERWGDATVREKDGTLTVHTRGTPRTHRQLDTVIQCQSVKNFSEEYQGHPAQFPEELPRMFLDAATSKGDIVADPFSGSGTTLIVSEKIGRRAYCMEMAPEYVDMTIRRWQKIAGKAATLEGDGRTFDEIAALVAKA